MRIQLNVNPTTGLFAIDRTVVPEPVVLISLDTILSGKIDWLFTDTSSPKLDSSSFGVNVV